eukprot:5145672-Pleurochrysis_carterae.AAC.2
MHGAQSRGEARATDRKSDGSCGRCRRQDASDCSQACPKALRPVIKGRQSTCKDPPRVRVRSKSVMTSRPSTPCVCSAAILVSNVVEQGIRGTDEEAFGKAPPAGSSLAAPSAQPFAAPSLDPAIVFFAAATSVHAAVLKRDCNSFARCCGPPALIAFTRLARRSSSSGEKSITAAVADGRAGRSHDSAADTMGSRVLCRLELART